MAIATTTEHAEGGRAALTAQLSSHGLSRWGGDVVEEFLLQLRGASGRKVYREMADNCPITGALLQAIEMAVRAVSWRVQPGSESSQDIEIAEFVESCLSDMSFTWEDTLTDILSFLEYGWAISELVYKRRGGDVRNPMQRSRYTDGRIGWRKLVTISQETLDRWDFDDDGGIQGIWQRVPGEVGDRYIPIDKALLFRTTARKNNPEGRSILRNAYTTFLYRKNVMEIMGIGLERDLTGLPLITAPPDFDLNGRDAESVATRDVLQQIVRDLKVDEQAGVILPFGFTLELLASPGSRQHNVVEILNYLDRRIAITALAQFILLGLEKTGSFALSESQTDLFTLSLTGWIDSLAEVFNLHAIPRLLRLNGMQADVPPKLAHGVIGSPNLSELADYVQKLTGAGALNPDDEVEQYLRQVANLPEMSEVKPEEPPRPSLARERIIRQRRDLLSDEQTLREVGYKDDAIRRILQEKRTGKLADTNIGEALLQAFERGGLTTGDREGG